MQETTRSFASACNLQAMKYSLNNKQLAWLEKAVIIRVKGLLCVVAWQAWQQLEYQWQQQESQQQ